MDSIELTLPEKLITILHGNHAVGIEPGFGGSIAFWQDRGRDILRPTSDTARKTEDIFAAASFPLVPFSNRIAGSRFMWQGREIFLKPNHPSFEHIIHGTGFISSWTVDDISENKVILSLRHEDDDFWPWSFYTQQIFEIREKGLFQTLMLENRSDEVMPAGLGFHPYFAGQDANLQFDAAQFWTGDADILPVEAIPNAGPNSFATSRAICGQAKDNCYGDWDGDAVIVWPETGTRLQITSSAHHAVLYIPKDGDHFSFEPVNHISNAVNMSPQEAVMPALMPGEKTALTLEMTIS